MAPATWILVFIFCSAGITVFALLLMFFAFRISGSDYSEELFLVTASEVAVNGGKVFGGAFGITLAYQIGRVLLQLVTALRGGRSTDDA